MYNPKENAQIHKLQSRTARPFQSVCFSPDGQYIAAGESAFSKPEITVWSVEYLSAGMP